jgi:antitoxin component HigA of HigAB toxin-antitoxin module
MGFDCECRVESVNFEYTGVYEVPNYLFNRSQVLKEFLRSLMEKHGLTHRPNCRRLEATGVVSEILSGEHELNIRQVRRVAKRFGVSPTAFIGP